MEPSLISKKKSTIPSRRNPSFVKTPTHQINVDLPNPTSDGDPQEAMEAMKRLRQIEKRSNSIQVRGPRRSPSVNPNVKGDLILVAETRKQPHEAQKQRTTPEEEELPSPMDEFKRERQNQKRSIMPLTSDSAATSSTDGVLNGHTGSSLPVKSFRRHESRVPPANTLPPPVKGNAGDDDSPLEDLKRERAQMKTKPLPLAEPLPSVPSTTKSGVDGRTGSFLPVKAFGRHDSRVPPTTAPPPSRKPEDDGLPLNDLKCERAQKKSEPLLPAVKLFSASSRETSAVEAHAGSALPVKAFVRHESKVPPNHTAPKSSEIDSHTGSSLPVKAFGRHESKVPGNAPEASPRRARGSDRSSIVPGEREQAPARTPARFSSLVPRMLEKGKRNSTSNKEGEEGGSNPKASSGIIKRLQSLQPSNIPSFFRKPTREVAAGGKQ